MDYAKESLRLHGEWGGKIEVVCTVPCKTKDDLSLAYTPGNRFSGRIRRLSFFVIVNIHNKTNDRDNQRTKQEENFPRHDHVYHLPLCDVGQGIGKGKKDFDFPEIEEATAAVQATPTGNLMVSAWYYTTIRPYCPENGAFATSFSVSLLVNLIFRSCFTEVILSATDTVLSYSISL